MYYAERRGLAQLHPEGMDCADIERIYKRELKNSKTRSKASHRKRHKANAERFKAAFEQCTQGDLPAHRIPEAAGGLPDMVSSLTPEDVQQIINPTIPDDTGPPTDYGKVGMIVVAGTVMLGGLIWLLRPKGTGK